MAPLPAETDTEIDMPRAQAGHNPQHLIVTLLGDYWGGLDAVLPTAVFLDLLANFGISASSVRAALARLVKRGVLHRERRGRITQFRVSSEVIERGIRNRSVILGFGAEQPASLADDWWTVVLLSLEAPSLATRAATRRLLSQNGYVALQEDAWIGPPDDADLVIAKVQDVAGVRALAFRGRITHPADGSIAALLSHDDLEAVRREYDEFIERFSDARHQMRVAPIFGAKAVTLRTEVMDAWRTVVHHDPGLPAHVLPPEWPRREARELMVEIYDRLGPAAEQYCREVTGRHAPDAIPPRHVVTSMFAR